MVRSGSIPVNLPPLTEPAAQADASSSALDTDSSTSQAVKQTASNQAASKTDAFEGAARQTTAAVTASLNNALTAGLSASDAAQLLGSFAQDAAMGGFGSQNSAAGLLNDPAALQSLSPPQLNLFLEGVLGQLMQLAQSLGQPLSADAMSMLATLNGQPATLLDAHTEPTTLWRAMALSNQPLNVLTLAATGGDVDAHSGLMPNQAYRVLGTFVDSNRERQVRLAPGGAAGMPTDEQSMLTQALSVPFSALQRSILLALIGDPRIDMPYAHELDEARSPGQANCCMFAHDTGGARGTTAVSQHRANLSEPRCRSCAFARQMCLPDP